MLVTICKRLLARSVAGTAKKRTRKQANCVELHPLATHVMLECYESDYRSMNTLLFCHMDHFQKFQRVVFRCAQMLEAIDHVRR